MSDTSVKSFVLESQDPPRPLWPLKTEMVLVAKGDGPEVVSLIGYYGPAFDWELSDCGLKVTELDLDCESLPPGIHVFEGTYWQRRDEWTNEFESGWKGSWRPATKEDVDYWPEPEWEEAAAPTGEG